MFAAPHAKVKPGFIWWICGNLRLTVEATASHRHCEERAARRSNLRRRLGRRDLAKRTRGRSSARFGETKPRNDGDRFGEANPRTSARADAPLCAALFARRCRA